MIDTSPYIQRLEWLKEWIAMDIEERYWQSFYKEMEIKTGMQIIRYGLYTRYKSFEHYWKVKQKIRSMREKMGL